MIEVLEQRDEGFLGSKPWDLSLPECPMLGHSFILPPLWTERTFRTQSIIFWGSRGDHLPSLGLQMYGVPHLVPLSLFPLTQLGNLDILWRRHLSLPWMSYMITTLRLGSAESNSPYKLGPLSTWPRITQPLLILLDYSIHLFVDIIIIDVFPRVPN